MIIIIRAAVLDFGRCKGGKCKYVPVDFICEENYKYLTIRKASLFALVHYASLLPCECSGNLLHLHLN